jgi:hypothetical protein
MSLICKSQLLQVGRMLNKTAMNKSLLMLACISTSFVLTGCRSMPGRNMFGMRTQPSAAALAGSGPTTTYPAPPSESATPEAIASVAGGTAEPEQSPETQRATTAQVAGIDVTPGYAAPASSSSATNMGAAQANGIYAGGRSEADKSVAPVSGYTFGSKALTPKIEAPKTEVAPSADVGGASYARNSSYPMPTDKLTVPSTSFSTPPGSSYAAPQTPTTSPEIASPTAIASGPAAAKSVSPPVGGYSLPTDSPAIAAIAPSSPETIEPAAQPYETANAFAPPAAASPDFSTASAAGSVTAPGAGVPVSASPAVGGGYMPGSTSTDHGYPTGDVESTSGGSFYR